MSNYHWVCFGCREAVRRLGSSSDVRCPSCGSTCENIGYKIPVPPKSKPKLWQEIEASYAQARKAYFDRQSAAYVRRGHDLEQEIAKIEGMESNEGRRSLVKRLKAELAVLRQRQGVLLAAEPFYLAGKLPPRAREA